MLFKCCARSGGIAFRETDIECDDLRCYVAYDEGTRVLAGHGDGDMEKMIFIERALADVGLCLNSYATSEYPEILLVWRALRPFSPRTFPEVPYLQQIHRRKRIHRNCQCSQSIGNMPCSPAWQLLCAAEALNEAKWSSRESALRTYPRLT